ncbi:MAG: hypothetical protein M1823_005340 [Watsoniomyces obsoletus]|nr:MAG: hypothetical protein M1823_005340 [Watsoniomyces obsoletus]
METGGDMTTDIDSKTDIGNNNNNNNNGDNPSDDTLKEEDSTADDTTKGSSSSTLGTFEREIRWRKREEECYQEAVSLELPPQRRYLTEEQAREAGIFNRDYWDKGGSSSSSSAFYTSPREIKEDITTRESESESNSDSKTKPLSMSKSRSKLIMTSSSTDPRRVASAPEETVWDPSRLIITPVSNALRDVEIPKVEKEHVWQLLGNAATALIASKGGASRGGMSSPVMRWRPVVLG